MADKKPVPVDLPEEELKKLAGKTVKEGEDEYVIVVQGVTLACVASKGVTWITLQAGKLCRP